MPNRLQLEKKMFPVQAFFNSIPEHRFESVLNTLRENVGYSINNSHCEFPNELDSDEEMFEGVRFVLFEEEVIITVEELYTLLNKLESHGMGE